MRGSAFLHALVSNSNGRLKIRRAVTRNDTIRLPIHVTAAYALDRRGRESIVAGTILRNGSVLKKRSRQGVQR